MAQFTVRNLEDDVKRRLQERAARHGTSMEEEVRCILRNALNAGPRPITGLGTRFARRFAGCGLTEPLPEARGQTVRSAKLEE